MKPATPREEPTQNEKRLPKKTCTMRDTDSQGHANLCCCYIVDEDGRLVDPCYHPADECC